MAVRDFLEAYASVAVHVCREERLAVHRDEGELARSRCADLEAPVLQCERNVVLNERNRVD